MSTGGRRDPRVDETGEEAEIPFSLIIHPPPSDTCLKAPSKVLSSVQLSCLSQTEAPEV